jgi:hypothetical protein
MQYLTDTSDLVMQRGAEISDCGTYRYRLWREWDRVQPTLAFLMLNPSTADHIADDPTISRCLSRAMAGKFGRLEVANLFPLRATGPNELLMHAEQIGPIRIADGAMLDAMDRTTMVICAWGAHTAAAARAADLMHVVRIAGMRNKLFHLGHPLWRASEVVQWAESHMEREGTAK